MGWKNVEIVGVCGVGMKLLIDEPEQPRMNTLPATLRVEMSFERTPTMQVRACTSRRIVCSLAAGLFTLPALAGTPAALDHVPSDAHAVIVVPNFGELLNDINAVNLLMGDQGEPMVMLMTSMVRGFPGLNLDGSLAVVLEFDEEMGDEPEGIMLIPVSDFGAFSNGHPSDGGIFMMSIDGGEIYFRDAGGGYAVLGDDDEKVKAFDASGGNLKAHGSTLGLAGSRITNGNDMSVYVNLGAFEELIAEGLEEMEEQGEMIEMMGGAEAVAGFDAFLNIAQSVANDGSSFAMGVNFDMGTGISYDFGLQFKDGSGSASYLQNEGDAGKYFDNVPGMDYFFASAFDMSGDGLQKMIGEYFKIAEKLDTTGMAASNHMKTLMGDVQGGVAMMGASDNIMGGLFSKVLQYVEVKDADKYIDATQEMYAGINEQMGELGELGVEIDAGMDAEPTSIGGVDAYGFNFSMDMSEMDVGEAMGGMNPGMIMGMIFGADGGPAGYMAKAGDGVIATMSKDAEFFSLVANAANGQNTMKGDASIAQTAAMLPDNRIMETYIAADHLINTAGPMLMMFGVIPEFEPMDALAPIGMGMSADGGGVLFRLAIPMQTIGSVMEMIPAEAFDDDGGEDMDF